MTPAMTEAANAIWADFKAYYANHQKDGLDWAAVVQSIQAGETGMGDYCDDNMFYFDVLSERGLISTEVEEVVASEEMTAIWNAVVEYVHTACCVESGPPNSLTPAQPN